MELGFKSRQDNSRALKLKRQTPRETFPQTVARRAALQDPRRRSCTRVERTELLCKGPEVGTR